ncbi:MAG: acetamidase/formamidase family protein [Desulfurococcaceae archaeon]
MVVLSTVIVPDTQVFYVFSPDVKPVVRVKRGDRLIVYTKDALGGQITSEENVVTSMDFSKVNPATGPIYVEDAQPGDALLVRVVSVEVAGRGFVVTAPGAGALPRLVREARTRTCYVYGDSVEFLGFKLPARKMIGVIGVATSEKAPTGVPGRHGGNLDTRFITEGSLVILPVEHPGALLGLGDLHAVMGDGEVCVAACEVPGKVTIELDVAKNLAPAWPVVQHNGSFYILVSHDKIEGAIEEAVNVSVEALSRGLKLNWHDAYMLASLAVDVGISQLVDPRKTAWTRIPTSLISLENLLNALSELR